MSFRLSAVAAATAALVLQGCASQPPAQQAGEDLNVGIAKTCSFTPVNPAAGPASSTISMTNDGWCAVRVKQADGAPYLLGLLKQRPEHGRVLIQKLGGETRLEYTPDPGFTGADRFAAALRPSQGADHAIQVAVNVGMGQNVAPAPAAATEKKPAATSTTPARKPTTSRTRRATTR